MLDASARRAIVPRADTFSHSTEKFGRRTLPRGAEGNCIVSHTSRRRVRTGLAATMAVLGAGALVVALPSAPAFAADTASINGATTYQTITCFGSSEAFGQAQSVMSAPAAEQQQILNLLYSTSGGAGLDILRNEISADSGTTIEPTAPSSPTATPSYLPLSSIGSDQGQLWFAQQIKAGYGVTNVFADAWSAPAFMKTNDSAINGGSLCGVPSATCSSGDWRQAYANYLVQYAKDYSAAGDPLTYVGPENEANLSTSYDSMQLSPTQTANFLDVLGPTVAASGLSTKTECCATEGFDYAQQYAAAIEADATANSYMPLFTSHGYTEAPTTISGWSKQAWETEWFHYSTNSWDTAWDDSTADSGITWAQNIYSGLTSANLNAFLFWYGTNVPSVGGNGSLLMLNTDGTVSVSSRLWAFANYSRFIRPGAVRIGATSSNSAVDLTAAKNTDGSVAIVALNTGTSADPITYSLSGTGTPNGAAVTPYLTNASNDTAAQAATSVSGGAFTATIPARSLVTYVIPASAGTGNTVSVTNPGSQSGTVGTAASLQVHATDSAAGQTLAYSATGLPAGLALSSSTGLISGTPTAAGSFTTTVTATDSTGASGSAVFTWVVNPAGGGGGCTVTYSTASQWAGGFVANVTIADSGTAPISGWTLAFTFPGDQKITNGWNGTVSQSGESVTINNAGYNATIAAGGSTSLGFQGTWTNSDAAPTAFTVNGAACTTG
jgi:O-glycosyl hydrolase